MMTTAFLGLGAMGPPMAAAQAHAAAYGTQAVTLEETGGAA